MSTSFKADGAPPPSAATFARYARRCGRAAGGMANIVVPVPMKITDIRTRVVEWHGPTVRPQPHFCTNPMDLIQRPAPKAGSGQADSMAGFRFHGWLIV